MYPTYIRVDLLPLWNIQSKYIFYKLHCHSKTLIYLRPMPDLEELMQEWPEKFEKVLKIQGFPSPDCKLSLSQYIDVICAVFDIPVYSSKIESLHMLFCLYAAIKNSQLYQPQNVYEETEDAENNNEPDQLVLE